VKYVYTKDPKQAIVPTPPENCRLNTEGMCFWGRYTVQGGSKVLLLQDLLRYATQDNSRIAEERDPMKFFTKGGAFLNDSTSWDSLRFILFTSILFKTKNSKYMVSSTTIACARLSSTTLGGFWMHAMAVSSSFRFSDA
jgi:hypothetical protein